MYNPFTRQFEPDHKAALIGLDIETLSMEENALITEIAMKQIAPVGGTFELSEFMGIDDYSHLVGNFTINEETVSFHDRLKGDYLFELRCKGRPSQQVADTIWIRLSEFRDVQMPVVIFCRGTDFDPPRLKHFMKVHGYDMNELVHYRNFRDLRSQECIFPVHAGKADHTAWGDVSVLVDQIRGMANKYPMFGHYIYGPPA